jgi:UDP-3-O-[3-hydroxymyristoyl] glucosamine N-acyltransferase
MVSGFPSRPHREWLRAMANLWGIGQLRERIKALEDRLAHRGETP